MLRERHQVFRTILIGCDAMCILAAQVGAYLVRFEGMEHSARNPSYDTHAIPLILLPLMALALFRAGLYQPRRDQRFIREAGVILRAVLFGTLLVVLAYYLLKKRLFSGEGFPEDLSRAQFAIFGVMAFGILSAWRLVFRTTLQSLRRRGWNLRHVAIIGTGRLGQVVYHTLSRNSWTGITPAYFVAHGDHVTTPTLCGLPVLGSINQLDDILRQHQVSGVFVALPQRKSAELPRLLSHLDRHAIDVRVVPDVTPKYAPIAMTTSELDGMPILTLRQSPLMGWAAVSKRIIDILGALAALIVFLPVMAILAILVRLSGPGPIIFRQPRASLGGRRFMIYKFRTMRHAGQEQQALADAGKGEEAWTSPDDPRITRIGRILRRTSLDELPQLFNVLLGEMSLVGPRPERPELIAKFREDWRGYILRQHVKAGMTGWAQVNGLRGKTSLRKRLQYDLFYIRNWSLGFDLRILWLTLLRGFVHPNAH